MYAVAFERTTLNLSVHVNVYICKSLCVWSLWVSMQVLQEKLILVSLRCILQRPRM